MSVPSNNLYDFIHQATEKKFFLLYFYPWGSKELNSLVEYIADADEWNSYRTIPKHHWKALEFVSEKDLTFFIFRSMQPTMLCHDQEPLNFDLYSETSLWNNEMIDYLIRCRAYPDPTKNLRFKIGSSWQKKWILLHSEINSTELEKYESTGKYIGAYWWSHALIARDWYRFAEVDQYLELEAKDKKPFLIYCRDVSGSRQYRSQFVELISDYKLQDHCQFGTKLNYDVSSSSSAEYVADDFISTDFSIVLETLFDQRIHLTEKTLRPIACGHPFFLAAGPGALSLLKKYGFKTFSPWINEAYDGIQDNHSRLTAIVDEMKRISGLPKEEKKDLVNECKKIARYNKNHFFSDSFYNIITDELKTNIEQAYQTCQQLALDPSDYVKTYQYHNGKGLPTNETQWNLLYPVIEKLLGKNFLLEQYQSHQHGLDDKSSTDGNDV